MEVYDILLAVVNMRKGDFSECARDSGRAAFIKYRIFFIERVRRGWNQLNQV